MKVKAGEKCKRVINPAKCCQISSLSIAMYMWVRVSWNQSFSLLREILTAAMTHLYFYIIKARGRVEAGVPYLIYVKLNKVSKINLNLE